MDPNNNQPASADTNPLQQALPAQPVVAAPVPSPEPTQPTPPPPAAPITAPVAPLAPTEKPKGNKKLMVLLILLLLLIAGMGVYVFFAQSQIQKTQQVSTDNQSAVIPTATAVPTIAPENDLELASPEADLLDIEKDLQGL